MLEIDGQPLAAQFGFRSGDTLHLLQEGFDPDYAKDRLGSVLRAHVLRQAISEGPVVTTSWPGTPTARCAGIRDLPVPRPSLCPAGPPWRPVPARPPANSNDARMDARALAVLALRDGSAGVSRPGENPPPGEEGESLKIMDEVRSAPAVSVEFARGHGHLRCAHAGHRRPAPSRRNRIAAGGGGLLGRRRADRSLRARVARAVRRRTDRSAFLPSGMDPGVPARLRASEEAFPGDGAHRCRLRAVLPLVEERQSLAGLPVRVLGARPTSTPAASIWCGVRGTQGMSPPPPSGRS